MRVPAIVFATLSALPALAAPPATQPEVFRPVPATEEQVRYDGHKVVRAFIRSDRDLRVMLALSDDPWSHGVGVGPVDFRVAPDALAAMDAAGIEYEVLIPDVQALIDAERARLAAPVERGAGWFDDFKDYDQISVYVDTLVALRPDIASRLSLGTTLEGREIFAIRITSAGAPADRPVILFNSLQHAREWATGMTTMYIADHLVRTAGSSGQTDGLLEAFEFIIVPVVNADGYVYTWATNRLWRKTRRDNGDGTFGVDPNRNWSFQWGGPGSSGNTGSETYRGPAPFSENCTAALSQFIESIDNLVFHIDFHSYGKLPLYAWGYTWERAPDEALLEEFSVGLIGAIHSVNSEVYTPGNAYRDIYPASGVAPDWTYGEHGAISYTVEVRDTGQYGFVMPPDEIIPNASENLAGVLWAAGWLAERPVTFLYPDGVPDRVAADSTVDIPVGLARGAFQHEPGSLRVFTRIGNSGPFAEQIPAALEGNLALASVPTGPPNSVLQFYLTGQSADGGSYFDPPAGPEGPHQAVALDEIVLLADDFSSDAGWTYGVTGDTALRGQWVRGDPEGTVAQPEFDRSVSGPESCAFTGVNNRGDVNGGDVDGGRTTLVSPVFDVTAAPLPEVSFWLWYSNRRRGAATVDDPLFVDVSNDNGVTWTTMLTLGPDGLDTAGVWRRYTIPLDEFAAPETQTMFRVVARDTGSISYTEAALDDVVVRGFAAPPACAADFNLDGVVSTADFFEFFEGFFGDPPDADFNHDGATDTADFFEFMAAFFSPCP